jgi:catechol 2,3-dioxygenase
LGFQVQQQTAVSATLGAGAEPLLILQANPQARQTRGTTGLYHFAILLPSRRDLAMALRNIAEQQIPLGGYSDHLVSEALYLSDPDGNGIEIYQDRPRETWQFKANGQMKIDTVPLNLQSLMGELAGHEIKWIGFPTGTKIGHIHLHVSDLARDGRFYTDVLGFDLVANYGNSAQFVSAGGYHHHIGMNTWAGAGIAAPPADAVGLRWYTIILPNNDALHRTLNQVMMANVSVTEQENGYLLQDPAGNHILLTSEES